MTYKLVSTNDHFLLHIDPASHWDPNITVYVGNPNHKSEPCIIISLDANDDEAILQEFEKFSTSDTAEMLQATLKWLMQTYPHIQKVSLTDKSYIPVSDVYSLPLPEYYLLAHGETMYQARYGAVPDPSMKRTPKFLQSYQYFRNLDVAQTPLAPYTNQGHKKVYQVIAEIFRQHIHTTEDVQKLMKRIHLPPITGTLWQISRKTIESYAVDPRIEPTQSGGKFLKNVYYHWHHKPYTLYPLAKPKT